VSPASVSFSSGGDILLMLGGGEVVDGFEA
jgi:hypothetical protein